MRQYSDYDEGGVFDHQACLNRSHMTERARGLTFSLETANPRSYAKLSLGCWIKNSPYSARA